MAFGSRAVWIGAFRWGRAATLAMLAVLFSTQAPAVPVYFDGPQVDTGSVTLQLGISEAAALAAQAAGVSIIDLDAGLSSYTGMLSVSVQNPIPGNNVSEPKTADGMWTISYLSQTPIPDDRFLYVVFATTVDPFYAPGNVGLDINPEHWAIFLGQRGGVDVYFPAFLLGTLALGDGPIEVPVHYLVRNQDLKPGEGGSFVLPQIQTAVTTAPVPEPSAVAMFALGLLSVAASRRHRR
jgi:hypothetical protein